MKLTVGALGYVLREMVMVVFAFLFFVFVSVYVLIEEGVKGIRFVWRTTPKVWRWVITLF